MPTKEEVLRACAAGPADSAIALLSNCAGADRPSIYELSCTAVDNDQVEIFRHVLQSEDVVFHRDVGLKEIITKRSKPLIEVLLERGWNINMNLGSYRGCAVTWSLITRAPRDFVEWLLDHGADPNRPYGGPSHLGHSLRLAASSLYRDEKKDLAMAELLLLRGADVNKSRALHRAAETGNLELVKLLVGDPWRADVSMEGFNPGWGRDERMGRPLHCAVMSGKVEIVEFLLDHGADVFGKDNQGNTPREIAEIIEWDTMVEILEPWEEAQKRGAEDPK